VEQFYFSFYTVLVGIIYGIGFTICFWQLFPVILRIIERDLSELSGKPLLVGSSGHQFFNPKAKVFLSLIFFLGNAFLVSPFLGAFYRNNIIGKVILTLPGELFFILFAFLMYLLLIWIVFVSKSPNPKPFLILYTWTLIFLGVLLIILVN
jgi:hypothetical protein